MKKLLSILLISILCLSSISFAETIELNADKESVRFETDADFVWVANEKQLEIMSAMLKKGYSEADALKAVDLSLYNELKKDESPLLKQLENSNVLYNDNKTMTESTRGFLPATYGNATWEASMRIEEAHRSNQIVAHAHSKNSGDRLRKLGIALSIVNHDTYDVVGYELALKEDTNSIYASLIEVPDDGTYYVHSQHAFYYIDLNGDEAVTAPCYATDEQDFTKY